MNSASDSDNVTGSVFTGMRIANDALTQPSGFFKDSLLFLLDFGEGDH
jgi:hypothetical protein